MEQVEQVEEAAPAPAAEVEPAAEEGQGVGAEAEAGATAAAERQTVRRAHVFYVPDRSAARYGA